MSKKSIALGRLILFSFRSSIIIIYYVCLPASCRYTAAHTKCFAHLLRQYGVLFTHGFVRILFFSENITIITVKKLLFFRIRYSAIGRFSRGFIITALPSKRHFGLGPWARYYFVARDQSAVSRDGESENVVFSRVHSPSFANHLWILWGDGSNRGK